MTDADSFTEVAHRASRYDADFKAAHANVQEAETSKLHKGADAALSLIAGAGAARREIDPETNKRLLRKIDLHIMPLICIVFFLQYIDKTAISYASVTGIIESAHLHGNQFNWVASIFFFGYAFSHYCISGSLTSKQPTGL
jgi:ACS family allantoate permease-like MFS transporter